MKDAVALHVQEEFIKMQYSVYDWIYKVQLIVK